MDRRHLRVVALTVAAALFMHNLDTTLIASSLPQIAAHFDRPAVDLSVGLTAYMLASAAFLPLSGWLGDRYSPRTVFVVAVAGFTVASGLCAAAPSIAWFVAARVMQGCAGALMTPVGRTAVLRHATGKDLLNAVALITWPGLLAPVIAPVLGGMITTWLDWRWNFLLNLPIGAVLCLVAWRVVPTEVLHADRPLDWPGLVYSSLAMFGLLYGLESLAGSPGSALEPWYWLGAGALALWAMFRHLARAAHPLLDLSVFRVQSFNLCNGNVALFFRASISATPFLLPLMLQLAWGLSALAAGTYVMIYFLGNVAMKPLTSPILRRLGFRTTLVANGLLSGLVTAACGFVSPDIALWLAAPILFLTGLTRSMQFTSLNTLGIADITAAQKSSGNTLYSMLLQVSMAAGVALAALVLQKSAWLAGHGTPTLGDFRIAFAAAGLAGVVSALFYLQLPRSAGAELLK